MRSLLAFSCFQNQAEAHYKGHKHARKLKAIEAQKNRQRRAAEASSTVKERDRDRERHRDHNKNSASEAAPPALMDTSLEEGSSTYLICFTLLSSISCASVHYNLGTCAQLTSWPLSHTDLGWGGLDPWLWWMKNRLQSCQLWDVREKEVFCK